MNEMQELINTITSTQMPDNSYPVFCLLKIEDRCHVVSGQVFWRNFGQ
jgi:hypothetical protein